MSRAGLSTVIFFFAAPGLVTGLVPWWITGWDRPDAPVGVLDLLGVALDVLGLLVVAACFVRFVREGAGTPAPVAPPQFLVQGGIYRHVRNPMYLGVAAVILGEASVLRSTGLLLSLVVFLALAVGFVRGYEERTLRRRFGPSYERYRDAVPGWWPRRRPWAG